MFKLLRYFSISSAFVMLLLAVSVGHAYQWYETSRMLAQAQAQNEQIIQTVQAVVWERHADYLTHVTERDPDTLKQSWQTTDIDLIVRRAVLRLPVLKVKILSADGTMLYSSNLSEVGAVDVPKTRAARKPAASSTFMRFPRFYGITGMVQDVDVVNTVVAFPAAAGGSSAIFEVFTDVTATSSRIAADIWSTILVAVGVCCVLYASLFLIVARADRVMREQYREISTFSNRLDGEVNTRTQHMLRQQQMLGEIIKSHAFRTGSAREAIAALNEAAVAMLGCDRCSVSAVMGDAYYEVIDLYDRRTAEHASAMQYPLAFFPPDQLQGSTAARVILNTQATTVLDAELIEYFRERGIRSTMDVPIYVDGVYVAVLCLRTCVSQRDWNAGDQLCAAALAQLAALAMQRVERDTAKLKVADTAHRLTRQQAVLTELMSDKSTLAPNLADVLRPMSRALAQSLDVERAGIWLLDPDKAAFLYGEIYVTARDDFIQAPDNTDFNRRVLELHRYESGTLAVNDVEVHPLLAEHYTTILKPLGVRGMIRAPIMIDGVLAGVISCAKSQMTQDWTPEQTLFATGMANLAALAVERHQRRSVEMELAASSDMLARQQTVINEIMHSETFRTGSLSAVMRLLSQTFSREAGIDRVAVTIAGRSPEKVAYGETYVRSTDKFEKPFMSTGWNPLHSLNPARPGRRIVANDTANHAELGAYYEDLMRPMDVRSFLQVPIDVGGQSVGVINASICGRQVQWSTSQLLFGTAIANLAALTIERDNRLRFETAIAGAAARLEHQQMAISDFMRDDVMRRGSLADAMQQLATVTAATLVVERVSFWRLAPNRTAIDCVNAYDTRSGLHTADATLLAVDHPAYFAAIAEGGEIAVEDIRRDPRTGSFAGDYATAADVHSMLDMPILSDGETVGVVCAEKCGATIVWSLEQRLFLSAVTNLAALVIERHERQKIEAEVAESADRLSRQLAAINALMENPTVRTGSLQDALRALSQTLCFEADADLVTIRVLPMERDDPGYAEAYNGRKQRHERITRSPGFDQGAPPNLDIYAATFAIDDIRSDRAMMDRYSSWVDQLDVGSAMQVPIRLHGAVTGAIRAMTAGRKIAWRPDQKMLVTAIAQLVALVVERHNRLRIERNLRHANRAAEQASKAKSQFLTNMSHEIRTPMNGVFGMTDLLMQTELSERQRRLVGTVHESAKTLLTLINDILDLSRIESGKMELEQQPFNLRQCIEGAVELFAEDAQRKGIELNLFVASQAPEHVDGDSGRLRQICVNLIGNALKFTTTGEVSIRVTAMPSATDAKQVQFEIRDTGIGIDPTVKARLFQPFVQADESITRRFGGTGLGLSISHHLVALMQGVITLESKLGQGTTVAFTVPMTVAAASRCAAAPDHSVLAGKRILVIDDRDSNREIMVDYLTAAGALPVNARSAELGFEMLSAAADAGHPFAGAIVDMVMPGINGLELCRTVRGDARLATMGLVLVTSMSWDGDSRTAREAGVHQLLTKPVRRGDLLDAMCRSLSPTFAAAVRATPARPKFSGHVLVAEDNPVNEEVAREFVTALGCTVMVAANGALALAAFEREHFDLILMDCQMPEMDGLTATQRIRELENQRSQQRTPIVAVTANAFAEDRVACLQAGMDDYLSKPFSERQLAAIFAQWLPAVDSVITIEDAVPEQVILVPITSKAKLDEPLLAELRAKRPQLLARLLSAYLTHAPKTVAGLSEAQLNGNIDALRIAAHSLKSSSANVGAKRMSDLSRRIEALVGQDDLFEAKVLVHDLELEFLAVTATFASELEDLRKAS